MNPSPYAIVSWLNENKKHEFSVLKTDDILVDDDDEEVEVEETYSFKLKKKMLRCVVKFLGSKVECEKQLANITSYKIAAADNRVNVTGKKNLSDVPFSLKASEEKSLLLKKKNSLNSESSDDSQDENEKEFSRKLNERDTLISNLNQELLDSKNQIRQLQEEVTMYKNLANPSILSNITSLSIQVLKYLGSERERDEVRKFGNSSGHILIHESYEGKFMSLNLSNRIEIMIEEKKSPESIFRTMAKALVGDVEVWGSNNGKFMLDNYSELSAARDFLQLRGVALSEAKFKAVLRALCSECKK
ncbi:unnamed protein product, partial [Brachionus calyciflorus]